MNLKLSDAVGVASILAVSVLAMRCYPEIPMKMPVHWDAGGIADSYLDKPIGVALLVLLPVLSFLVLKLLPMISPQGFRMEKFGRIMDILVAAFTVTVSSVVALAMIVAAGYDEFMTFVPPLMAGALFVVLGFCLGKTTKNFFIGIRTPWTLASDAVWERTHRLAGRLFLLAGMATMVTVLAPVWFAPVVLTAVGTAALVPVISSFFTYRGLHGFRKERD